MSRLRLTGLLVVLGMLAGGLMVLGCGEETTIIKELPTCNRGQLAFRADKDTDEVRELYTVDPDGLDLKKVSGTMPAFGDIDSFLWAPSFVAEIP